MDNLLATSTSVIVIIIFLSFFCEYIDATLGMGYGTILTPVLIIMDFSPIEIVPAILLSQFVCGLLAGVCHHREGNINIKPDTFAPSILIERLKNLGYIETARKTFPLHLKIALLLATCSIIGTVTAVFVAVNIPVLWLKIYIGSLITIMGLVILLFKNHKFRFSPKRIFLLGLIASANKGMSGGGYGPVVTSGQLLTGIEGKSAVGITSLAEGLTCFVGVICYMVLAEKNIAWHLAPYITCGAVLSVPLSAKSVKLITTENLKWIIALVTTLLGLFTLTKTIMAI